MSDTVKIAFERKILDPPDRSSSWRPRRCRQGCVSPSNIAGLPRHLLRKSVLIEPLSIARQKGGSYLLLDGHMRLDALRFLGATEAPLRCRR